MANEAGYSQQVEPQPATPLPQASPEAFGAGVAQATGDLGQTLHVGQIQAYSAARRLAADQQLTDASARFATHRLNMDGITQALRTVGRSDDTYSDHLQRVDDANQAGKDAVFAGITEDSVRREMERQWTQYSERTAQDETAFVTGQAAAKTVANTKQTFDTAAARVQQAADVPTFMDEFQHVTATTASIQNLTVEQQDKLGQAGKEQLALGLAEGMNGKNPDQSIALLDGGFYNGILDAPKQAEMRRGAEVEIHKREIAARAAGDAAKVQARANNALLADKVAAGQVVPDAQFVQAEADAKAVGLPDADLFKIKEAHAKNQVNYEYHAAGPADLDKEIYTLQAVKTPSDEQVLRLNALVEKRAALRTETAGDPLGVAARAGMPVTPIDFTNPAPGAIDLRQQQALAVAQQTGAAVLPILPDELTPMKNAVATGSGNARDEVLGQLDRFSDPFVRAAGARQVAPEDKKFQHQAQILPENRATMRRGQEAIAANPDFLKPDTKHDPSKAIETMMARVEAETRVALKTMSPADVDAVIKGAQEYMAGQLFSAGHTGISATEDDYRRAMRISLGGGSAAPRLTGGFVGPGARTAVPAGVTSVGGISHWMNPQQPFVLPDDYASSEFAHAVTRDRFTQERAGGGPVADAKGTPFSLNNAYPVLIAPNRYRWETSAGTVQDKRGGDYVTVIGPNPRMHPVRAPAPGAPKP